METGTCGSILIENINRAHDSPKPPEDRKIWAESSESRLPNTSKVQSESLHLRLTGLHESLQPCSRAARKWRENEEMKRKRRGNGERMRKWRENFLILPLYPPSLSISYIKICHILSQNVKYVTFVAKSQKNQHMRYEEIILGRIYYKEAPQIVPAWQSA